MREASAGAFLVALVLLPAVVASGAAPSTEWVVLIRDDALDASVAGPAALPSADPRADILEVAIAEEAGWLWLKLTTRDSIQPVAPPTPAVPTTEPQSLVEFALRRAETGERHQMRLVAQGNEAILTRDGDEVTRIPLVEEERAWRYTLRLPRWQLLPDAPLEAGDAIEEPWATTQTTDAAPSTDRAPSVGFGEPYKIRVASNGAIMPAWTETQGADFAAGPSLAIGPDGVGHVAYIVYNAERGTAKGLYHATFQTEPSLLGDVWRGTRVADASMQTELHEDRHTQTAIAVDPAGAPHIAFHPRPNTGGGIRYATPSGVGWIIEDPARLANGRTLPVDDTYRAIPAIHADGQRVVLAFQSGRDVVLVERQTDQGWHLLTTLTDARFPRLDRGADGLHVAWLGSEAQRAGSDDDVYEGTLRYAKQSGGWRATDIASGVMDLSAFWETSETDGSFAFALAPEGTPSFVYETSLGEPTFAQLRGSALGVPETEPAPLTPSHGNPQVRMRMLFDDEGRAHVLTGYGGTDTYAIREGPGLWMREETPRQDMAQLALTPDGRAITAYTQPHGGTTVAVRAQTSKAGSPPATASEETTPLAQPTPESLARFVRAASVGGAIGLLLTLLARTASWWGWRFLAVVGGFSRIARPAAAEHETRASILALASREPGLTARDMRGRLGIARSTFFYHLRRLERERFLTLRAAGPHVVVLPVGAVATPATSLPPHLRALVDAVRSAPDATTLDHAARLRVPRRTMAHQLRELEARGIVRRSAGALRPARWRAGDA